MLAIFTYKHLQTLTNISYKVLNTHADIIQPGKNGPGLHQDVTNTPDSPGTRNDQEQDCTRMLQGILQSIHLLSHIAHEITRIGPLACYSQWTMETAIGNLGEEIRQDYNPFANISQCGIIRAQTNAIKSMMPNLALKDKEKPPQCSVDLGQGYILLRACDTIPREVSSQEAEAILNLWLEEKWPNRDGWAKQKTITRWAGLHLPNGQKVRSAWGEKRLRRSPKRTTIVKTIGECKYFFQLKFGDNILYTLAVLSIFSPPDLQLLKESHHTIYSCHYQGDDELVACNVNCIKSLVAMVPYFKVIPETGEITIPTTEHFLVEKPHLELTYFRQSED
ncbi:hypothetical protein JOM56_013484 [Amanita muscaria]